MAVMTQDIYGAIETISMHVYKRNVSLKMRKGKTAAQCAHAAVGVVRKMERLGGATREAVEDWDETGAMKIVVESKSLDQMEEIESIAKQMGLLTYFVRDAGHTQIAPGSKTVLAIGPANKKVLDQVTGSLKLLN